MKIKDLNVFGSGTSIAIYDRHRYGSESDCIYIICDHSSYKCASNMFKDYEIYFIEVVGKRHINVLITKSMEETI